MSRGEWTDEQLAADTYAALYNTVDSLGAQLEPNVWRLIYDEPVQRNRQRCWTQQAQLYRPLREPVVRPERYNPPPRTYDSRARRSYEAQINDPYLCGMHAFNNVANRVWLTPTDLQQSIELVRPRGNRYAEPGELTLAALREGVLLVAIRLAERNDLVPLNDEEEFPRQKCTLQLLEDAGGLILYQPTPGSRNGHFVSLTFQRTPSEPTSAWTVHSFNRLVSRGSSAMAALDDFVLGRLLAGTANKRQRQRERRRRAIGRSSIGGESFIGLMPFSLSQLNVDPAPIVVKKRVRQLLQRMLARRAINFLRADRRPSQQYAATSYFLDDDEIDDNDAAERPEYDLTEAPPVSPNALDELCFLVTTGIQVDKRNSSRASDWRVTGSLYNGLDQTNPASMALLRHSIDEDINRQIEEIGIVVLREFDNDWTSDPYAVVIDDDGRPERLGAESSDTDDATPRRQYEMATVGQRYAPMLTALRLIRSTLRETPGIGVYFNAETERESYSKFTRLVSNRQWLRYIALQLTTAALAEAVGAAIDSNKALGAPIRRLLVLLLVVGYDNLRSFGVQIDNDHPIIRLFRRLTLAQRARYLPLDDAPDYFQPFLRTAVNSSTGQFVVSYLEGGYEWNVWLLTTAQRALPNQFPQRLQLGALRLRRRLADQSGVVYDNRQRAYDELAEFVSLLRRTLFKLPLAGQDFATVKANLRPQKPSQTMQTQLASDFRENGRSFVQRALADAYVSSEEDALDWVDVLAFDSRYARRSNDPVGDWAIAATDTTSHDVSNFLEPRIAELAGIYGFNEIHRQAFGTLTFEPDQRPPPTNNQQRIPPANSWLDTQPRTDRPLCTAALESLQLSSRF